MPQQMSILLVSAASIAFVHTLFGPDHYLPFIVMAKSGQWSLKKTTLVTLMCGLGHVASSVLLGLLGIVFGIGLSKLTNIETLRGSIAAWALIAFGLIYFIWGVRRAIRNKPHTHLHAHEDGIQHEHAHKHQAEHVHAHDEAKGKNFTPWVLFTIFILGPCEPLIPLLMYPAANNRLIDLMLVVGVFAMVTLGTMLSIVLLSTQGLDLLPTAPLERYVHALAGATIFLSGLSIQFLGI